MWLFCGLQCRVAGELLPHLEHVLSFFVVGPLTGDYSWVDRIWSLLPAAYVWVFAIRAECDLRLVIMAIISSLWALRLTYNFVRKGLTASTSSRVVLCVCMRCGV